MKVEPDPGVAARIDEIYSRALELNAGDRPGFVKAQCGADHGMRLKVDALLAAAESSGDPFDQQIQALRSRLWRSMLAGDRDVEEDLSGQRIYSWRIEEQISRGGLATVYRAHRDDGAFEQVAAFKVLRRGLDTEDVIARFRAERQILSSLTHPAIAQILDGGALPDGRPFLVLEFVPGLPVTAYCKARQIDPAGRVQLVIDVLRALHHAHTHLVVHRDVKPSNILVSDEGNVVLLDFGIAKLLDAESLPGGATMTRTGVSLLTPGYASPEQYAAGPVTTASDIYQAGLVLYELLAGQRPFVGRPVDAEFVVPPPSAALRESPHYQKVRGDLDAITAKATHLDPAMRYASADEMVQDLTRYLDGRAVLAQPDTLRYRLRKLAGRKPWLMPLIGIAIIVVASYVTTLTVYSARLQHEQQLAAAAQQFMVELFRSPDPYAPADPEHGLNIRVVDALAIGERRVRSELADQAELRAALLASISDVYASLDQFQEGIRLREEAMVIETELYGASSARVVESLQKLGVRHAMSGDLSRAGILLERQLKIAQEIFPAGSPELTAAQLAYALHEHRRGNFASSNRMLREGVAQLLATPQAYPQMHIEALITLEQQKSLVPATPDIDPLQQAQQIARLAFGNDSLQQALVQVRLASSMTNRGEYEDSERIFLAAIPVLETKLGEDHSSTLGALNNLGYLYHRRNDLKGAERIHRELLQRKIAKFGAVHREVADSYQNLAGALTHQARYDESLPLHRQAYEIFRAVLNEDNYVIAVPLLSIAFAELQRDQVGAAEMAAREALRHLESATGQTFFTGVARCLVGVSLERQGRLAEGQALVAESHELLAGASLPAPYPELCRLPIRLKQ